MESLTYNNTNHLNAKMGSGDECYICYNDYGNNDLVQTTCGHGYHSECLNNWFITKKADSVDCPYCQQLIH